jgi:hypothetical protein
MNIFDVVYTPLDTPKMPEVDVPKLLNWIDDSHKQLHGYNKKLMDNGATAEARLGDKYPWKLTPVYFNSTSMPDGWLNNFNIIFPELSTYFCKAFDLDLEDLGGILLLPTVDTHQGLGFWHQDTDSIGLRMYLAFDDFNNQLLTRKTKIKYTEKLDHNNPLLEDLLEDEILNCKILDKNQCFFLNNVNAAHTIYTNVPNKTRIAVFFAERHSKRDYLISKIEPLVINSAKKFSDYSIIW